MADVTAKLAELEYITNETVTRDAGAAWSVAGLGVVRSDANDPAKVAVNSTDGGKIAGAIPRGHINKADGARASIVQFGRYELPIQDSETLAMGSELACNASGKYRLAIAGDYVVALSLGVVTGTGQTGLCQLLPEGMQYPFGEPTIEMPANVTIAAAAGGANVCEVTYTVVDEAGSTIAGVHHFIVYLSDAATGAGETATSASGTVQAKSASGADIAVHTAKKTTLVQTLATGVYVLEITDTAKTTFYPCAVHPVTGRAIVGTQLATGDYGA